MGEHEPDEEEKRKRAEALMGDYISEREELREGPHFHVPPFVESRIEGTKTVFYMPVDAEEAEAPAGAAQPEPAKELPADIAGPPSTEPPKPVPFDFPKGVAFEPSRPVSFRKPFMKPDTLGRRRAPMEPFPRRPSAKDLIARLRVVKEGVETREQVLERMARAAAPAKPEAATSVTEEERGEPSDTRAAAPAGAAVAVPQEAVLAPAPSPAPQKELEQKTEGGKLCPSCGSPISDRNRLLICTGCGKVNCDACGRYELTHMKSDIYYEYQFDFPLCLSCYGKAFSIQRLLGRAGVCYGNGNYSYALYYTNQALEQDPESKYAPRARDLMNKINKAHEAAHERDKEWRLQRKQFMSRNRQEDPSWR